MSYTHELTDIRKGHCIVKVKNVGREHYYKIGGKVDLIGKTWNSYGIFNNEYVHVGEFSKRDDAVRAIVNFWNGIDSN